MNSVLEIQTLGRVAIRCDGRPIEGFESRKSVAMLVYLAFTGHEHPRTVLAEMFCDGRSESLARNCLRRVLCNLNEVVGSYIVKNYHTASMNPDSTFWIDVVELERTLRRLTSHRSKGLTSETAAQIAEALDLYQGDFLDGFYSDCASFENWCVLQREQVRFLVIHALDQLVDYYIIEEDYQTAIACATRLLLIDDLREETYRQMMRLLALCRQRVAALSLFRRFCKRLEEDFPKAKPAPETEDLFNRIRSGEFPVRDEAVKVV